MPATVEREASVRSASLDTLRGLAVALMVLDHVLAVAGDGGSIVRLTLTRVSLPLFALVAGALMRERPNLSRLRWVLVAGVAATAVGAPIGIGQPDVLLLFAGALVVAPLLVYRAGWSIAMVVAILQPVTWPIAWSGYQPGTVLALVILGAMVGKEALERAPAVWLLAQVGRRPLAFYLGHLVVLLVVVVGS